jgi:ubiquinone/menaquinone biosynthesis C-methylase UbiE
MKFINRFKKKIIKQFIGKNFWINYFKVYDSLNDSISYQKLKERIIKETNIEIKSKILDAGCGTGNYIIDIYNKGADYYGIDNILEVISIAKRKAPFLDENNICFSNLGQHLSFDNNYFDRIICNNVLYTMSEKDRTMAIQEFFRVLKPGGIAVMTFPKKGYRPYKIYLETIRLSIKKNGRLNSFIKAIYMTLPTAKIMFYNYLLNLKAEKGKFHYYKRNELLDFFKNIEFNEIKLFSVYAGETFLVKIIK